MESSPGWDVPMQVVSWQHVWCKKKTKQSHPSFTLCLTLLACCASACIVLNVNQSLILCLQERAKEHFLKTDPWIQTVQVCVDPPCWAPLPIKAGAVSPPAAALHHRSSGQHLLWQRGRTGGRNRHRSPSRKPQRPQRSDLYWPPMVTCCTCEGGCPMKTLPRSAEVERLVHQNHKKHMWVNVFLCHLGDL